MPIHPLVPRRCRRQRPSCWQAASAAPGNRPPHRPQSSPSPAAQRRGRWHPRSYACARRPTNGCSSRRPLPQPESPQGRTAAGKYRRGVPYTSRLPLAPPPTASNWAQPPAANHHLRPTPSPQYPTTTPAAKTPGLPLVGGQTPLQPPHPAPSSAQTRRGVGSGYPGNRPRSSKARRRPSYAVAHSRLPWSRPAPASDH